MATYQSPDAKKEEFRKYLDRAGVVDALTKGESLGPGATELHNAAFAHRHIFYPPTCHSPLQFWLGSMKNPSAPVMLSTT
jgi:hypothetical protein